MYVRDGLRHWFIYFTFSVGRLGLLPAEQQKVCWILPFPPDVLFSMDFLFYLSLLVDRIMSETLNFVFPFGLPLQSQSGLFLTV